MFAGMQNIVKKESGIPIFPKNLMKSNCFFVTLLINLTGTFQCLLCVGLLNTRGFLLSSRVLANINKIVFNYVLYCWNHLDLLFESYTSTILISDTIDAEQWQQ